MLRSVFTIINLFFVLITYSQSTPIKPSQIGASNPSSQYEFNTETAIKFYLSTSSYFYDLNEPVLCNLLLVDAKRLQPIYYSLPCKIVLFNSKGEKTFEKIYEINQGSLSLKFDTSYFKTGGEYTLVAENNFNGQKLHVEKRFIIQSTIRADAYFDIKTDKEQYVPGDELNMLIHILKSDGSQLFYNNLMLIEWYGDQATDTFYRQYSHKVGANFHHTINKNFTENNLAYQIKAYIDGEWQTYFERISLNTNKISVKSYLENGYYKYGDTNTVIVFTSNVFGALVEADCIAYNLKSKDSFLIDMNAYGMGKFVLPIGDSLQDYVVFTKNNRNRFYQLMANHESQIKLSVKQKSIQSVTYLLKSNATIKGRFICHLRGMVLLDTQLILNNNDLSLKVDTKRLPPGILQALFLNVNDEILAQKLCMVNRQKQLKIQSGFDSISNASGEREYHLKIMDEQNNPVEGLFNLSLTDHQNFLVVEDLQSNMDEYLLFESDLQYPVKDVGKIWKSKPINNDSIIDLFLNGCEFNNAYLPSIIKKRSTVLFYYQLKLDRYNSGGGSLKSEVKKVTVKSNGNKFTTTINDRNEIYIPLDSVVFPCQLTIHGIHKEKFIVDETYVKITMKSANFTGLTKNEKDSFLQLDAAITKLYGPIYEFHTDLKYTTTTSTIISSNCRWYSTAKLLNRTALRGFASLAGLSSGVTMTSSGLSGRGSRTDGTAFFIDGVRVLSPNEIPNSEPGYLMYNGMGFSGGGGSRYGFTSYYSSSSRSYQDPHDYIIKKYRPNGTKIFNYPEYLYTSNAIENRDKVTTYVWHTGIKTNSQGEYRGKFSLPEKTMVYHLKIEGISNQGLCGVFDTTYNVNQPYYMVVKSPVRVNMTDTATVSCTVYNNGNSYKYFRLTADLPTGYKIEFINLAPKSFQNIAFKFTSMYNTDVIFTLQENKGNTLIQTIEKSIVVDDNFSKTIQLFNLNNGMEQRFKLSSQAFKTNVTVNVYKSPVENLRDKMVRILREPHGCFEQVSSTNFPNILAYKFLMQRNSDDYKRGKYATQRKYLISGYQKLVNYETQTGGFSWYGDGKGNEALTAMGLLQFQKLGECGVLLDLGMLNRNKRWLYKSQNEQGVFVQSRGKYGFSNSSPEVAHAYITYVLSEIGDTNLNNSIAQIKVSLEAKNNLYIEALLFATYLKQKDHQNADLMFEKLALKCRSLMKNEGPNAAISTVVNSSYNAALNESLSIIANSIFSNNEKNYWTLSNEIGAYILRQDFYLIGNMQTQAMALESMNYYLSNSDSLNKQEITFNINGRLVAFGIGGFESKSLNLNPYLDKDFNTLRLVSDLKSAPISELQIVAYFDKKETIQADADLNLNVKLVQNNAHVGDIVYYGIRIENTRSEILPQTIAIVPLPAGVNIKPSELLYLKQQGYFDFYEIHNGQLVLYFEELNAKQKVDFKIPLTCEIRGVFETGTAYLYKFYRAENKTTSQPGKLFID